MIAPSSLLRRLFPVVVLLCLLAELGMAQRNPLPYGRRFIIGFPDTLETHAPMLSTPIRGEAEIILFAEETANVTITGPNYQRKITVRPDAASVVSLMDPAARPSKIFFDQTNTPASDLFTITADRNISAYCYFATKDGSEAFAPMPVETWGVEYYVMQTENVRVQNVRLTGDEELTISRLQAPGQALIIAAEDSTRVTIDGTATIYNNSLMPPYRTVVLNAGQAYLLHTRSDEAGSAATWNSAGTRITATKPIGVIAGNTRGVIRKDNNDMLSGNTEKNCLVEWLLPADAGGYTFAYRQLLAPGLGFGKPSGTIQENLRLFGTRSGSTRVNSSLLSGGLTTIAQGQYLSFMRDDNQLPFAVTTDKPAQAMIITGGFHLTNTINDTAQGDFSGLRTWRSAMVRAIPQEQWIVSGRFHSPRYPAKLEHAVAIIAEQNAQVQIDGVPVAFPSGADGRVSDATFRHAWVKMPPGDHRITATNGRFTAIAFGWMEGVETYRPVKIKKEQGPALQHPSEYDELAGASYAYPVLGKPEAVEGVGEATICSGAPKFLPLTNTGPDTMIVTNITLIDPTGRFKLNKPKLPDTLGFGEILSTSVEFTTATAGEYRATLQYTVTPRNGSRPPSTIDARLVGLMPAATLRAHIGTVLGAPGDTLVVPVVLDDSLDALTITGLQLYIRYDTGMVAALKPTPQEIATMVKGTLLEQWDVNVVGTERGEIVVAATAKPGAFLTDTGRLLNVRFWSFMRLVDPENLVWQDTSSLKFDITVSGPTCAQVKGEPGKVQLLLCGLRHRAFVMNPQQYALLPNAPNPFNPSTTINFSLGLDGQTWLEILDNNGRVVATLVHANLAAGEYSLLWDATGFPSGLYYCRVRSGDWQAIRPMMLVK
ncbi:MAG: hypothetical protein JNJ94_13270 [Chlorobi bacterium]|nr:hypothetical protein [Chlorobiota bacterium]